MLRHVRFLLSHYPGASAADIARAAGVSRKTVANLLDEYTRRPTLYRGTAQKILGVSKVDSPIQVAYSHKVARRMVEALQAQGHSMAVIGERTGLKATTLSRPNAQRLSLRAREQIAHAYDQLRLEIGRSDLTATKARNSGYAPWSAWQPSIRYDSATLDLRDMEESRWKKAIQERRDRGEFPLS